jgi:peptide deformylase
MIIPILTQDHEHAAVLRTPTKDVESFDEELRDLVADMWDSMYAANGVGLAATQIGSSSRVAVIDVLQTDSSNRRLVMVNPKIERFLGVEVAKEGCLSMPGLRWDIPRSMTVVVSFRTEFGKSKTMVAENLLARAVQHECDHLDGILCNSRAEAVST